MKLKKQVIVSAACAVGLVSGGFAQDFPGYRTGNYSGVNGVFFNPANVVDSRFRWDVNLFSMSANVSNNNVQYRSKDMGDLFKSDSVFMSRTFPSTDKPTNAFTSFALNLPSVMFNINQKNSVAITTRVRAVMNANDIDSRLINVIRNTSDIDLKKGYTFPSTGNATINLNGWTELGLTYGHVFVENGKHFFKAGITPRYLAGVGNAYAQLSNLQGTVKDDANGNPTLYNATGAVAVGTGGVSLNKNMSLGDGLKVNGKGWGGDVGFVYEYRPDYQSYKNADGTWMRDKNKYKLRVGAALLDYGKIRFDADPLSTAAYAVNVSDANAGFNLNKFNGQSTISDISRVLDQSPNYFTKASSANGSYQVSLPTTVQLDVDYKVVNHFYVNAMGILSTVKRNGKLNNSRYYNSINVTPRYESKIFDLYLPLSYNQLTKFNAGAGLRVGPVFAGTGSGLTALIDKSKQADVYFGVHIGIQHKAKKVKELPVVVRVHEPAKPVVVDSDNDGVPDDQDKCPNVAGLAKYNGCPIPDSDNDGVNDEEDKCPNVRGLAKYHGCPIPDSDGDGINDEEDQCPTIPGVAKYHGCPIPDTDGDGLNDEVDKCPTVAGPKENHGCPEIKKETIAKIEKAADHIYFQTGKAAILAKSNAGLNEVAKVLNEDPSFNLDIKGHTDNVGKPAANQKLSQQRADAVKAYFVKKGISESRLTSTGYGDSKPIAPNTTAAGRQKNRRVEMMLKNY